MFFSGPIVISFSGCAFDVMSKISLSNISFFFLLYFLLKPAWFYSLHLDHSFMLSFFFFTFYFGIVIDSQEIVQVGFEFLLPVPRYFA